MQPGALFDWWALRGTSSRSTNELALTAGLKVQ